MVRSKLRLVRQSGDLFWRTCLSTTSSATIWLPYLKFATSELGQSVEQAQMAASFGGTRADATFERTSINWEGPYESFYQLPSK